MALESLGQVNIPRESTFQELLAQHEQTNAYLAILANESLASAITDFSAIQRLVQAGYASKIFTVGDQINVTWTDKSGTEYTWPFNVVHFDDVTLEDGEVVPGMFLQAHYCSTFGVQFDQSEALYYCDEALPAGTYYFTIGTNWGTYCVSGSSYYFTTTEEVPAGGQIRIGRSSESDAWGAPDQSPSNWVVHTYESTSATEPLESALTLTEGTEGTSLGTTTSTIDYADSGINNLQRAAYGYNRWSHSGIRQYLNSAADAGAWWAPQNNFDRPPAQLASYPGFMAGFDEDFLNILKPIKVTTALNTVSDDQIGTQEDTYDTFFLASLEQQFITPQLSGVEGDAWDYWKRATGSTTTIKTGVTGAFPITYALNAKTSAQNVRLRSASRGYAYYTWFVGSTGTVTTYTAYYAHRFSPACVVC